MHLSKSIALFTSYLPSERCTVEVQLDRRESFGGPEGRLIPLVHTIKEKVDKAMEGATVKVQHTHSYCIEKDLKEFADIRLWNRSIAFGLTSVVLVAIIAIIAIVHYNSEAYWGKQYYKVYSSPYLTDKEREKISRNVHTIAILPNEFDKDPKRVKEQIKNSKAILKERKKEARRRQKDEKQ